MIALVLAAALSTREYRKEVEAIVAQDQKTLASLRLEPETRAVATDLILLDSYLVLNELRKLPRATTRERVDKLVAQLSRDMESLPR